MKKYLCDVSNRSRDFIAKFEILTSNSFGPTNYPQEKIETHEILTMKYFGTTK